ALADRIVPRARLALPVPGLLDQGKPEDGVQVALHADRGLHRRGMAPPGARGSRIATWYSLARPVLFALDPETAHKAALRLAGFAAGLAPEPPPFPVRAMGIDFPNPVGLAAGFDKDAQNVDGLAALGFGFLELGGVTPRAQPGNPRPRLFRIPEAQAIINRYGLNSVGVDAFVENLSKRKSKIVIG